MSDKKILIEAKDIKKSFKIGDGMVDILKGLNFSIKEGEFLIIFGPSGCGKSTLLHTLLGLEAPTSGKIIIEGKDYYAMIEDERSTYRRHHVGMIYQQPLWIGSLNVIDNVMFPLRLLDLDDKTSYDKAIKALTVMGMEKWANYMPMELSSGQQQKVSLARAMSLDPVVIVADEPTGNLDTVSGQQLLETFVKLVEGGKTIIMVTHDLEYLKYATKIIHMIDGEIVEEYEPKHTIRSQAFTGKKVIGGVADGNVRDKDFLKKLNL